MYMTHYIYIYNIYITHERLYVSGLGVCDQIMLPLQPPPLQTDYGPAEPALRSAVCSVLFESGGGGNSCYLVFAG